MRLYLSVVIVLLIGCKPQLCMKDVVGTYTTNSRMSWHSLRLNCDSTFEYKYSYDLGGDRDPIIGRYYIVEDKIIINSSILPQIANVKESTVIEDSLTVKILDKDLKPVHHYPFIKINDWKPEINMTLPIILSGYWKVGINSQITPIRTIQFTFGNYPVEYHPINSSSNQFVFQFNINSKEFFRETFLVNEPLLFKDEKLYPLSPTGYDYNMDNPMSRIPSNK